SSSQTISRFPQKRPSMNALLERSEIKGGFHAWRIDSVARYAFMQIENHPTDRRPARQHRLIEARRYWAGSNVDQLSCLFHTASKIALLLRKKANLRLPLRSFGQSSQCALERLVQAILIRKGLLEEALGEMPHGFEERGVVQQGQGLLRSVGHRACGGAFLAR